MSNEVIEEEKEEQECSHDCSTCGSNCSSRTEPQSLLKPLHEGARVKKVFGVVSGKGGVGKSMVASQLAVLMQRRGYRAAVLDADITGPSIPKGFGIKEKAHGMDGAILPCYTETGVQIMSINLMLKEETDPVVWRGPVITGVLQQFWSEVLWDDVDYMFIDMPPGTGDVTLTVFQMIPLDGIIVVTSPQDLVSMVVEKAVKMAEMMEIPMIGVIENMSYMLCPDCGKKLYPFGEGKTKEVADKHNLPLLAQMPIDPAMAAQVDKGLIEQLDVSYLDDVASILEK